MWARLLAQAAGGAGAPILPSGAEARAFWNLYAPVAGEAKQGVVLGQIGQSLDGRIATPTGHSRYVNGPEAIVHLHRLRALVDAVVIGVGTALADDPQLTVRAVPGPNPARVVIDPNGRLPEAARLLAEDGVPVFAVQGDARKRSQRIVPVTVPMQGRHLDPRDIVAALAGLGFRRLLIEGGAHTLSAFLSAGALGRLHICIAPLIIGSGPVGLDLPPIDTLEDAYRPKVSVHRLGTDVLFDCCFAPAADVPGRT